MSSSTLIVAAWLGAMPVQEVTREPAEPVDAARLAQIAADRSLSQRERIHALRALEHFGAEAIPLLTPIADDAADPLRSFAESTTADVRESAGIESRREYFARRITAAPFDRQVRAWLNMARAGDDLEQPDPLIAETKRRWRERLATQPDAQLAMELAWVIAGQLHGSELGYGNTLNYRPRERAGESYATLAEALEIARKSSNDGEEIWRQATVALAKLELLRGDWEAMNARLIELGERPIQAETRPLLAPPPKIWSDLAEQWQPCDAEMRSGDCAFELKVEQDGRGMRGVHVLLREAPPDTNTLGSGIDTRTLFLHPAPLSTGKEPWTSGFGYGGNDRSRCRYAVTGDDGVARFEGLPPIEVLLEVMVPTASCADTSSRWDLWVRQDDGSLELDRWRWKERIQLSSGTTTRGPHLVARPNRWLNVGDGAELDPSKFELVWTPIPQTAATGTIRYELELIQSFPPANQLSPSADSMARLATTTVETTENRWPLAREGVGGIKLVPGNVYLLQVTAHDQHGTVLGRFGRVWCWVPWAHRSSATPLIHDPTDTNLVMSGLSNLLPGEATIWHLTDTSRLDDFAHRHPNGFELEYVQVGRAWLAWCSGDADAARATLEPLAAALLPGNVAGDTARSLLERIAAKDDPGRQLVFSANAR